tara:strand:- start:1236 stop:2408 length:1173 start_codon:yes stop_codon:yes gene_type:complete
MSHSKLKVGSVLGGAALVALGVAFAGQATAGEARVMKNSKDQVSLKVTGQFSTEMHMVDDGFSTRVRHQDANYSSSRFRFIAGSKVNSNLKVKGVAEIAMNDARNAPSNARATFNSGRSGNDLQTRKTEVIFTHNQMGRVYIGAGSAGADGVMNINTHGVYSSLPGFMGLIASSHQFKEDKDTLSGASVGGQFADLDFNSRQQRVRYDTPAVGGFMLTMSHSDRQTVEAAIRFSGKMFDSKVKAGIGTAQMSGEGEAFDEMYGAQVSMAHKSGLGFTMGCGFQKRAAKVTSSAGIQETDNDRSGCHTQGHLKRKFNSLGASTIVVEYDRKANMQSHGDVATGVGVNFHQKIDAAALEVWVKYSNYDLEREVGSASVEDIDIISLGTRMKF